MNSLVQGYSRTNNNTVCSKIPIKEPPEEDFLEKQNMLDMRGCLKKC